MGTILLRGLERRKILTHGRDSTRRQALPRTLTLDFSQTTFGDLGMNLLLHLSGVARINDDRLVLILVFLLLGLTVPLDLLVGKIKWCRALSFEVSLNIHIFERLSDKVLHQELLPKLLFLPRFLNISQFLHVLICLDRDI